jgi:hypothetical protein
MSWVSCYERNMIQVLHQDLFQFAADEVNDYSITFFRPSARDDVWRKGDIELRSSQSVSLQN